MFKPNLPPPPEKTVFPKPKEKTPDQPMDQEVMGAIEKEKAPKDTGDMNPIDIIRTELEAQKSKTSPEKMYMALVKLSKTPNIRILRANNSMMVLNNKMDGTGEGQVFIADKPEKMVESFKQFHDALVKAGLKKVSFTTTRPGVLKILKSAGLNFTSSRGQVKTEGGLSPAIKVEVLA
jgi:hypothetical protein